MAAQPYIAPDRSPQRWLVFTVWTLVLLWSMDIARPNESQWVGSIQKMFVRCGMPECMPAKLYHCSSFGLWTILLAGALANGYLRTLARSQRVAAITALILFAGIPELLQHLNRARTPSWFDVGVNITGGLIGLALQAVLAQQCGARREPSAI